MTKYEIFPVTRTNWHLCIDLLTENVTHFTLNFCFCFSDEEGDYITPETNPRYTYFDKAKNLHYFFRFISISYQSLLLLITNAIKKF